MHDFWDVIIKPIFDLLHPAVVVEIGSGQGKNTENLIQYAARHDGVVHAVDPCPDFPADEWESLHENHFVFHRSLSLSALEKIPPMDVVLIDGDHNWYTVINELRLIDKISLSPGREFPVVFLHDIGWPYGRRDLYYNPENIPELFRKPYQKKGLKPGESDLLDEGGLNAHLFNALYENSLQNGVLTAVEDFLKETARDLSFFSLAGFHGLGILVPKERLNREERLGESISRLTSSEEMRKYIEHLEHERILSEIGRSETKQRLETASGRLEEEKKKAAGLRKDLNDQRIDHERQIRDIRQEHKEAMRDMARAMEKEKQEHEAFRKARLRELNKVLSERDLLIRWLDQASSGYDALLTSRRWKMGNRIGEFLRKAAFRPPVPLVSDRISRIFGDFRKWEQKGFTKITDESLKKKQIARSLFLNDGASRNPEGRSAADFYGETLFPVTARRRSENVSEILSFLRSPSITVIVPVFNAPRDTAKCLDALLRYTSLPCEILVIDDGSTDPETIDVIGRAGRHPFVRVIRNDRNRGFVETLNRGLEESTGDVVCLNSDTAVTPRWLQKLVLAAYSDPRVATVTPFSNAAGAFSVPEIGVNGEIDPPFTLTGMSRMVERLSANDYPKVPTGNGFCLYIKRSAIGDVGLFDSVRFGRGYGEENDFSMRALKKGWTHVLDDASFVYHRRGASFSEEKEVLAEKNRKVLDELHPEYTSLVRTFVASPEIAEIRSRIRRGGFQEGKMDFDSLRILFVLQEGMGGTPATNEDLLRCLGHRHECFVLTSDSRRLKLTYHRNGRNTELWSHTLKSRWSAKSFHVRELEEFYFTILTLLKIEVVHVRHLFKHSFDIVSLCRLLGLPVVLSFHDYYLVCPSIHLLDERNHCCHGDCSETAGPCRIPTPLLDDISDLRGFLPSWRDEVRKLFDGCRAFVTTSPFARSIYVKNFPELEERDFRVIEHGRDFADRKDRAPGPAAGGPMKLLIPGNLDRHKGSDFIRKLHETDRDGVIEFHFMGRIPPELAAFGTNHGVYEREDFIRKVTEIDPHFIGIFSISPETYCHTLTEAWASGVPVLSSDTGTVAERIGQHGGGWLLDLGDVPACYEKICHIFRDREAYGSIREETGKIPIKTVADMATEYEETYYRVLHGGKDLSKPYRSLALLTPRGTFGFPGSSYVRTLLPLQHPVFREAFFTYVVNPDQLKEKRLAEMAAEKRIDCFVIQRNAVTAEEFAYLATLSEKEKIPIVFEIDDNILDMDPSHPEHGHYGPQKELLTALCRRAHHVTVSTEALKDALGPYNNSISVIRNALEEKLWFSPRTVLPKPGGEKTLTIGYMGSVTHDADLEILRTVIPRVQKVLREQKGIHAEFQIVGGMRDGLLRSRWYTRIPVPSGCESYPLFVDWLRKQGPWDIAVAPLADTEINRGKSELKYLEYAALGSPGVYSPVGGYADTVRHGVTGLLATGNDEEAWVRCLLELALDASLREKLRAAAREDVIRRYLLKDRVAEWRDFFHRVLGH